ncbi:enhanced serine sensitivity protein SseB C-terminal domain-containing protein [Clostridium sp. CM028]|nr:enhanced serine sensitivity protein SseB C-terminal domain-containing protein [Clostridium sp. CM028]WLC62002.1 enhanced serine sensitivity protein SseB C-terminal domain-containing protein [Clostridium sp. CM028]
MKKQKNVQAAYLQLMVKESEQSYLVVDFME